MKEGSFLWAVEQMKQGKKVRRNQHENTLPWVYSNGEFYIIKENGDRIISHLSMSHFEATDWEVVEEPKKTLWDKVCEYDEYDKLFSAINVREALKEYIEKVKVRYNQYFNNEIESNYNNKIIEDAKEIFGEELLK